MRQLQVKISILLLSLFFSVSICTAAEESPGRAMAIQTTQSQKKLWVTTDHSKHEILKQKFASGPEVTKACLSCHTEAAMQFHKTIHWTWIDPNAKDAKVGKGGYTMNNFCINLLSNEPRCTSCHAGYGWKDKNFDFTDQSKVDCLVCHEQTGTYKKFPTAAGNPVSEPTVFPENNVTFQPPDWNKVAQSVGRPTRQNCGVCHFYGGGGDAVKHGDLDSSMFKPNKALDVHMGVDGKNFDCVRCHTTTLHNVAGRVYSTPASLHRKSLIQDDLTAKIMCESCHSATPHKSDDQKLNDHTDKVACQTCHIPTFARVNPTKMSWDWSSAGKKKDGKPYAEKGPFEKPVYDTKKGSFRWEKDVVPEYFWFSGSVQGLTAKDTIDPGKTVKVNWPVGNREDANSRIFPFKVHRGKQPYDKANKTLVIPHLFGSKESGAYWGNYDWKLAIDKGMEYAGLPFSGQYDFVETSYVFPTTHMVAPKDKALRCDACHSHNGRLAALGGFYMPGRDRSKFADTAGWVLVFGSLAGVVLHGLGRMISRRKDK
jgi:octaheme c-type cytochrome (tetrathionate reductase family)